MNPISSCTFVIYFLGFFLVERYVSYTVKCYVSNKYSHWIICALVLTDIRTHNYFLFFKIDLWLRKNKNNLIFFLPNQQIASNHRPLHISPLKISLSKKLFHFLHHHTHTSVTSFYFIITTLPHSRIIPQTFKTSKNPPPFHRQ